MAKNLCLFATLILFSPQTFWECPSSLGETVVYSGKADGCVLRKAKDGSNYFLV